MTNKQEYGISTITAFLLLLSIIAVSAGLWAVLVLPEEQHAEAEIRAETAQNALYDTLALMQKSADSGLFLSVLLPKGTLRTEESGYLRINETSALPLRSLVLETGTVTHGITAGGIWRQDSAGAAWTLLPELQYESGILCISIPAFSGDIAYGAAEGIPFTFSRNGFRVQEFSADSMSVSFVSADEKMRSLWETVFRETAFQYEGELRIAVSADENQVTAEIAERGDELTLQIREELFTVSAGGNR